MLVYQGFSPLVTVYGPTRSSIDSCFAKCVR